MIKWCILAALCLLAAGCPAKQQGSARQPAAPGATATAPGASSSAQAPAAPVSVWADPALKVPLDALAAGFKAQYPAGMSVKYVERGQLLRPLVEQPPRALESPPEVFIVADRKAFEVLRNARCIDEVTARTFAGDRLVVVHRPGENWASPSLFDIYKLRFEVLACGSDGTSLGYYTRQALISDGVEKRVEERIKRYDATEQVVKALAGGEAQLAITFASTAAQAAGVETMLLIGDDLHDAIRYQAVAAKGCAAKPGVAELLRYLAENPQVQQEMSGHGLLNRQSAMKDTH
jgi:molybdenum ABC transporter molybdate-binding protein